MKRKAKAKINDNIKYKIQTKYQLPNYQAPKIKGQLPTTNYQQQSHKETNKS